jgi:hypothetical protein
MDELPPVPRNTVREIKVKYMSGKTILPTPYDIEMTNDIWIKDENNQQNNSQSISELESESSN